MDELEIEGEKFSALFLLCRFGKQTEQVEHSAADKLEKLNDIVTRGGIPYGLVGYVRDDNGTTLNVYSRLLEEYQRDDESLSFLREFVPTLGDEVRKSGLEPNYLPTGQWLDRSAPEHQTP